MCSQRLEDEIKWICSNPIITNLNILDPTFNSGPSVIEVLAKLTTGGYTGSHTTMSRRNSER